MQIISSHGKAPTSPQWSTPVRGVCKEDPGATLLKNEADPFLSAIAHEIRNPLATIHLSVALLTGEIQNADLQNYLDIIRRSAEHIDELIKDLLAYQQTELPVTNECLVHQLLDEILEITGDRLQLKKITAVKKYADRDCIIAADKAAMKLAIINIVVNAIEAMDTGRGTLTISTMQTRDKCIVTIEDNGCGISKQDLKQIFTPYFSRKSQGLGVGLAATQRILRSNNVLAQVQSQLHKGTRFILSFKKMHLPAYGLHHAHRVHTHA